MTKNAMKSDVEKTVCLCSTNNSPCMNKRIILFIDHLYCCLGKRK